MARPELGNKHSCTSCGAKFYDLNRSPFICPKCGQAFTESPSSALVAVATPAPVVEKAVVAAKVKVPQFDGDGDDDDDEDEVLADVEIEDIEDDDDTADDAFLQEDEDEDVTGIIGGGIGGKEES